MRQSANTITPTIVVSCVCFALMCLSAIDAFMIGSMRNIAYGITGFVYSRIEYVYVSVDDFVTLWADKQMLTSKAKAYQRQIAHAKLLNKEIDSLRRENYQLKNAIQVSGLSSSRHWLRPPYLIQRDKSSHQIILPCSSGKKLAVNQLVLHDNQVVGRVTSQGRHSVNVQMITDIHSSVPVIILNKDSSGILVGTGASSLEIQYMPDDARIAVGDIVHSKKIPGIYEDSFPIGKVTSIQKIPGKGFLAITVEPFFDINYQSWFTVPV
ncbi:MAG: rod shape-determining protein MreC [Pseudomonadota bacterium]|nr:rod shape-determining protein MreC [Pseudomonadota bacterium]